VNAAAKDVTEALGGCHILCANVGVQQFGRIDRLTEGEWSWVLNVNVLGMIRTVSAFLPLLREADGWRQVALTASSSVLVPGVRLGAYITSKHAVLGYGEVLRMELAEEGIGVSVVFPAGMSSRHLESSAKARPAELGEWTIAPDDVEALMSSRSIDVASHVVSPEQAVRNLLAELRANHPYIITHGEYRAGFERRVAAIEAGFDRMSQA
jgi:NAD(P)-dependent dehydrogenase (short-subunit alcohol dehydrogenase family)